MGSTTITLPEEMLAQLRTLAHTSHRSLDEVVREAVEAYLAGPPFRLSTSRTDESTGHVREPLFSMADPVRRAAVDAALSRLREGVPRDLSPDEIDAEIDAAWDEVREARRERRATGG